VDTKTVTRRGPRRRIIGSLALALAIGVVAGFATFSALGAQPPMDRPLFGPLPGDVDGDGVVSDSGPERIPAFVSATGDNGIAGYVRLVDLDGPAPQSPAEALRQSPQRRVIPVFAADGRTVIDHLTESPSVGVVEKTAEELNRR
jgi:hypothetical protein